MSSSTLLEPDQKMDQDAIHDQEDLPRSQVVRLLLDQLALFGYKDSFKALEKESKILYEDTTISDLRHCIIDGRWDDCEVGLLKLNIEYEEDLRMLKFQIRQQKYLELVESGKVSEALSVLRNELTPLQRNSQLLHKLSSCILFSNSSKELKAYMKWSGSSESSRLQVLDSFRPFIPQSSIVPRGRMVTLIKQALELQETKCPKSLLHSKMQMEGDVQHTNKNQINLFEDHSCSRTEIEWKLTRTLRDFGCEVHVASFSKNGQYMAAGGSDGTIVVYEFGKNRTSQSLNSASSSVPLGQTTSTSVNMNHTNHVNNGSINNGTDNQFTNSNRTNGSIPHSSNGFMNSESGWKNNSAVRAQESLKEVIDSASVLHVLNLDDSIPEAKRDVVSISWSSNSDLLLIGYLAGISIWKISDGTLVARARPQRKGTDLAAAHFLPDATSFISGGLDGKLKLCSVDLVIKNYQRRLRRNTERVKNRAGSDAMEIESTNPVDTNNGAQHQKKIHFVLKSWRISPINDLIVTQDGKFAVTVDQQKEIRWTDLTLEKPQNESLTLQQSLSVPLRQSLENKAQGKSVIRHTLNLTSCTLSEDGNLLVVTTTGTGAPFKGLHAIQKIFVYNVHSRELVGEYNGQKQSRFVIKAGMGGPANQYIASGSEDTHVHIWNRTNSRISLLKGHTSIVNAVAWNPKQSKMLVTVSDDQTIRIWVAENSQIEGND